MSGNENFFGRNFLANFALPEDETPEGDEVPVYCEVIYAELNKEEATKLVEEYNKVGFNGLCFEKIISLFSRTNDHYYWGGGGEEGIFCTC
jgi:hypothetical protein